MGEGYLCIFPLGADRFRPPLFFTFQINALLEYRDNSCLIASQNPLTGFLIFWKFFIMFDCRYIGLFEHRINCPLILLSRLWERKPPGF